MVLQLGRPPNVRKAFKMRTIVIALLLLTPLTAWHVPTQNALAHQPAVMVDDDYCDGWKDGWAEGWKYIKGQYSLPPLAPICPIPEIGKNKYKNGYNRGFVAGMRKAQEK